jgi:UDP-N-acetylmuramoyl-tripeptide--D-alanyl-D-alanine ligase
MTEPLWSIDALIAAAEGVAEGARAGDVLGLSIDTRSLKSGDLFIALKDQRDGHEFVPAAFAKGAVAALVARDYQRQPSDGLLIRVDDPLRALERIAVAARARLAPEARIIAVTGSAGKTTTKEMLRACCERLGATHASAKSFNNHWGVPLTLAAMPAATRYAIFEIGMNHAGEIGPLVAMVRPHVAMVTTVVSAHLEHFGTEEAIADAKAEIFSGLGEGGAAIINFDNAHYERLRAAASARPGVRVVPFSGRIHKPEDFDPATLGLGLVRLTRAHEVDGQTLVDAHGQSFVLGAVGSHMVANSVAVVAALKAAGANLTDALRGLARFRPPEGRGSRIHVRIAGGNLLLIDESYNANPASMRAALLALAPLPRTAHPRRIAVLGDMLELGSEARALHVGLADAIHDAGIDLVFASGANMRHLFDALPEEKRGAWSPTSAELQPALLGALGGGDVVMIKGSNGSRMAPLVAAVRTLADKAA